MADDKNMLCPAEIQESLASLALRNPSVQYRNDFAMRDYLERLIRHKRLILCFTGGFMLMALVISLLMTPVYEAKAILELNIIAPKVTKFEDIQVDPSKTDEFIQTQVELFQSASLADRVIKNLKLASNPAFNPLSDLAKEQMGAIAKIGAWLKAAVMGLKSRLFPKPVQNSSLDLDRLQEEYLLRAIFAENLNVIPKSGTKIISVSFSSSDPILAQNITNELVGEFIKKEIDRKLNSTKAAKRQSEEQIGNVRAQLSKAETELRRYAQEAGIVSLDSKTNLILQELEQMNQSLAEIETERIKKKEQLEQAKISDIGSLPSVLQSALIQNLKNQYIDLMSEYEKFRIVYKDDYPEVKRIRAKMEDINQRLNAEQDKILKSLLIEYQQAEKVKAALTEKAKEKKDQALKLNTMAGKYKILENELEVNKQIYLSLLERSKEIDANAGTDLGNIQLVDLASVPLFPYRPNTVLYVLVAALLGLMSGTGLAFWKEYGDDTIKKVDEISSQYWLPMLAVLPAASKKDLIYPDWSMEEHTPSAFAEGIRFARVSLGFSSSPGGPVKSLLITSTAASEGKSTISVHLAHSFADSGENVLLIDADLRKASRYGVFPGRVGYEFGLTHYLNGDATLEAIIRQTKVPNLYFVHSGYVRLSNPTDLLNSSQMKSLVENLKNRFDRIIFDGPPFGADVLVLGNLVEGIILITTLGQTRGPTMEIARKSLLKTNSRLIWSIVNNVDCKQYPESRYYQNYYSSEGFKAANYLVHPGEAEETFCNLSEMKRIILNRFSKATK